MTAVEVTAWHRFQPVRRRASRPLGSAYVVAAIAGISVPLPQKDSPRHPRSAVLVRRHQDEAGFGLCAVEASAPAGTRMCLRQPEHRTTLPRADAGTTRIRRHARFGHMILITCSDTAYSSIRPVEGWNREPSAFIESTRLVGRLMPEPLGIGCMCRSCGLPV